MPINRKALAGSTIASICCGGSLAFASFGLGAFWSSLGFWRYIPQTLAVGALSIVAINYFFYCRAAKCVQCADGDDLADLRRSMFMSATLGLAVMAGSFVFLEWLNHAVINPHRFLGRPEYGQAIIPGVPNIRLVYALVSFSALALLWALPFPNFVPELSSATAVLRRVLRVAVFLATVVVLVALIVNAARFGGTGRDGSQRGQHSPGFTPGTGH